MKTEQYFNCGAANLLLCLFYTAVIKFFIAKLHASLNNLASDENIFSCTWFGYCFICGHINLVSGSLLHVPVRLTSISQFRVSIQISKI